MAYEKKIADEMLTNEELEKISGGTDSEFTELQLALSKCTKETEEGIIISLKTKEEIQDWLKTNLNIKAKIYGDNILGKSYTSYTDPVEDTPNEYTRNGQSLTHGQVMAEIKRFLY